MYCCLVHSESSTVSKEYVTSSLRVEACFAFYLRNVDFLPGWLSTSEDGGSTFLQNTSWLLAALYPRRQNSRHTSVSNTWHANLYTHKLPGQFHCKLIDNISACGISIYLIMFSSRQFCCNLRGYNVLVWSPINILKVELCRRNCYPVL
jgi:hypothetical protein